MMRSFYFEERYLVGGAVSREIAYHLYARQLRGNVVIVTDTPVPTLAAVRKQWVKLTRRAQRERSSTLNAIHLVEIGKQIARMQSMQFVAKSQLEAPEADVFFVKLDKLLAMPPICHTLYITCGVTDETLADLTNSMPRGALVVLIRQ
jgi:hypothetical protein